LKITPKQQECNRRLQSVLDAVKLDGEEKTRSEVANITNLNHSTAYRYLQILKKDRLIQSRVLNGGTITSTTAYCFPTTETKLIPDKIEKQKKVKMPEPIIEKPYVGQKALPRTPPPMNTVYKPSFNVNYTPSGRVFQNSSQSMIVDKSK
jgi:hypothetical protein